MGSKEELGDSCCPGTYTNYIKSNLQILSVSFTLAEEPSMTSFLVSTPPSPPIFVFSKEYLCQD